mgnify:CR=1 FL=1|tara:strand:- start:775 stop:1053 length:279 start_codon:yes stop_codon:yes gene_type:complete
MSVPASGNPIGMKEIYNEIRENQYNSGTDRSGLQITLSSLSDGTYDTINTNNAASDRPDGSAPHGMDEFYGYNHDEPAPGGSPPAGPPGGGA